jgi:hypothetical protein
MRILLQQDGIEAAVLVDIDLDRLILPPEATQRAALDSIIGTGAEKGWGSQPENDTLDISGSKSETPAGYLRPADFAKSLNIAFWAGYANPWFSLFPGALSAVVIRSAYRPEADETWTFGWKDATLARTGLPTVDSDTIHSLAPWVYRNRLKQRSWDIPSQARTLGRATLLTVCAETGPHTATGAVDLALLERAALVLVLTARLHADHSFLHCLVFAIVDDALDWAQAVGASRVAGIRPSLATKINFRDLGVERRRPELGPDARVIFRGPRCATLKTQMQAEMPLVRDALAVAETMTRDDAIALWDLVVTRLMSSETSEVRAAAKAGIDAASSHVRLAARGRFDALFNTDRHSAQGLPEQQKETHADHH